MIIFPLVKACSYCGRESNDDARHCWECGTEFPVPELAEREELKDAPLPEPMTDLSGIDLGFKMVEGYSRPDWKLVYDYVAANVPRDDLPAAWNFIALKWLEQLACDLGGHARVRRSPNFFCLSDSDSEATGNLLAYAEAVLDTIKGCLGEAAMRGYYGKHALLLFSDQEDYYAYISYFDRDGTHILSGGVFLADGYAHIAMPFVQMSSVQHTLVHELTHNLLCHLPIPLWLNEGLAMLVERLVARRGSVMDRELAGRHYRHWNETNIQAFWAGKTFHIPGDDSELSYSLGAILVELLSEKGLAFKEFVRGANWRDAGQDAAVNIFGEGLEQIVSKFLGPGNWRPQRQAIKAMLKFEA